MAIYTMTGFAPADLFGLSGGTTSVGSTIRIDPTWSASTDAYTFQVEDADWLVVEVSDSTWSGDNSNQEVGDDGYKQTLTLKNAAGQTVTSGRSYVEDMYTLQAPDGTTVHVYTVEIAGTFVGAVADGQLIPGVSYTVTNATNTNGVSYNNIVNQTYDANAVNELTGSTGSDTFYGGGANDKIAGKGGNDSLYGDAGSDTVVGGRGNDLIYGGSEGDVLIGDGQLYDLNFMKSGNPVNVTNLTVVNGADGPITLCRIGTDGSSTVVATIQEGQSYTLSTHTETNYVLRDENNYFLDSITGAANQTFTYSGSFNDSIYGGAGNDVLVGQMGNDIILGDAGNDTVYGGAGDDHLSGVDGSDTVYGGDDRDVLYLGDRAGTDLYDGGSGGNDWDVLNASYMSGGVQLTLTGDGAGTLKDDLGTQFGTFTEIEGYVLTGSADVFTSNDSIVSNETIWSGDGADTIYAGAGWDIIDSGTGNDVVYGGADGDQITSGDGSDTVYGGAGDDQIYYGLGDDIVYGGTGNDTIDDIAGSGLAGTNTIYGGDGHDVIYTGLGNDLIYGDAGNDQLFGEVGDDRIYGGDGNDLLGGAEGNDILAGGAGNDIIVSGSGNDTIVVGAGRDIVTDFNIADDDLDGKANDQLDVSGITNAQGGGITYHDVVVTNDGNGNALLTFPNGEQIVLQGVSPTAVDTGPELFGIGIPCFTAGTMILTPTGEVPVEMLRPGDLVVTRDNGPQRLIWAGARRLSEPELLAAPELRPIKIEAGGWGGERGLLVSPQHGMYTLTDERGGTDTLVRAKHLARLKGGKVRIANGVKSVTYVHIMFAQHQVVFGNGIASESFYPGEWGLRSLAPEALREIIRLFPDLQRFATQNVYGSTARPVARFRDLPPSIRDMRLHLQHRN